MSARKRCFVKRVVSLYVVLVVSSIAASTSPVWALDEATHPAVEAQAESVANSTDDVANAASVTDMKATLPQFQSDGKVPGANSLAAPSQSPAIDVSAKTNPSVPNRALTTQSTTQTSAVRARAVDPAVDPLRNENLQANEVYIGDHANVCENLKSHGQAIPSLQGKHSCDVVNVFPSNGNIQVVVDGDKSHPYFTTADEFHASLPVTPEAQLQAQKVMASQANGAVAPRAPQAGIVRAQVDSEEERKQQQRKLTRIAAIAAGVLIFKPTRDATFWVGKEVLSIPVAIVKGAVGLTSGLIHVVGAGAKLPFQAGIGLINAIVSIPFLAPAVLGFGIFEFFNLRHKHRQKQEEMHQEELAALAKAQVQKYSTGETSKRMQPASVNSVLPSTEVQGIKLVPASDTTTPSCTGANCASPALSGVAS